MPKILCSTTYFLKNKANSDNVLMRFPENQHKNFTEFLVFLSK